MIRRVLGRGRKEIPHPTEEERERERGGFFIKARGGERNCLGPEEGRERERERWQRLLVCRLVVVQYQGQGKAMDEYRSWSVRPSVARESLWGHWQRELNNGYYPAQQHAQFPKAAAAADPSSSHQCWLNSPAKLWLVHNLTATHTHTPEPHSCSLSILFNGRVGAAFKFFTLWQSY
jgi:hypothetical protein